MKEFHTSRELISPAQAQIWLTQTNTRNRPLSQKSAVMYAKDMIAGNWYDTHQGIAFYEDGVLADGQTRLAAIVLAGRDVSMLVTRGLTIRAAVGVDAHRMRSAADHIAIAGIADWIGDKEVSIAKIFIQLNGDTRRVSVSEITEVCKKHREAIEFATANFSTHVKLVTSAPTKAAVALAFSHVSPVELQKFCRALVTGVIENVNQSAAIRLREKLLSSNGLYAHSSAGRLLQVLLTERAIKAFCEGEKLRKLIAPKAHIYELGGRRDLLA